MREAIERFLGVGSDLHRQVYHGWREYPKALAHAMFGGFNMGFAIATLLWIIMR